MWEYVKTIGVSPEDNQDIRLQKFTLLIITVCCCIAAPVWSAIYYFLLGLKIAATGPMLYFLLVVPSIIHFAISKKSKLLINVQLFSIFFCPTFMQCVSGGLMMGAGVILWAFLAPLSALLFHDVRKARMWFFILIGCIIIMAFFNKYLMRFGHELNDTDMILLITMNICGPCLAIYFAMQYFVNTLSMNSKLLQHEKQKSDALLLNILPVAIAEELKSKGKTTPLKYCGSTVLFTDFKDFTKIAEQLTPEQLITELDNCFRAFDEIIGSFGLEKIKTIGDAYMCVAGLPLPMENSALNAVHSALKITEYMRAQKEARINEGKGFWEIRIGIHTGDVIAGVVGQNKFAYDIWGDAVNTASRMESSSDPGKINISGSTYNMVKDHFVCSYRGKIPAKNKGIIDMYFVEDINRQN